MLPRTTVTGSSSTRVAAVAVRSALAPAPTGSSTIGWPSSPATFPAARMVSIVRAFSVPMLSTRPPQMRVISGASSMSSAMMGEPPQARSALAQSLTVT